MAWWGKALGGAFGFMIGGPLGALMGIAFGHSFDRGLSKLDSPEFERHVADKFNVDLTGAVKTITVRKFSEPSDGNIHTDHWSKIITLLVYFNPEWEQEGGRFRVLRSGTDIDDFAAEVAPLAGTVLAFHRCDRSWHGYRPFKGERRMVQLNYLDQSPIAVAAQRISRFGTHFMKNVLGMR